MRHGSGLRRYGTGRLGLLDSGACGHGVGAHFHALLGLLAGLGQVLALNEGLLDNPGQLARRDGFAPSERAGARTAGRQQQQCEPNRKEGGQTLDRGRAPIHRTWHFGPRTLDFGPWTWDFRGRRSIQDCPKQSAVASVYAPLDFWELPRGFWTPGPGMCLVAFGFCGVLHIVLRVLHCVLLSSGIPVCDWRLAVFPAWRDRSAPT